MQFFQSSCIYAILAYAVCLNLVFQVCDASVSLSDKLGSLTSTYSTPEGETNGVTENDSMYENGATEISKSSHVEIKKKGMSNAVKGGIGVLIIIVAITLYRLYRYRTGLILSESDFKVVLEDVKAQSAKIVEELKKWLAVMDPKYKDGDVEALLIEKKQEIYEANLALIPADKKNVKKIKLLLTEYSAAYPTPIIGRCYKIFEDTLAVVCKHVPTLDPSMKSFLAAKAFDYDLTPVKVEIDKLQKSGEKPQVLGILQLFYENGKTLADLLHSIELPRMQLMRFIYSIPVETTE